MNDAVGWFEELYADAAGGRAEVPWDRPAPSAALAAWFQGRRGDGASAVVVGCGYGRDAEFVASLGFVVTAFDVAPSAVAGARDRHPTSPVRYEVADLLALPPEWDAAFELVVESHNVQSLPPPMHPAAAAAVASLVAPGGTLLVLAAAADGSPAGAPPWPLTRAELAGFAVGGVVGESIEEVEVDGIPRWRAVFRRPA